MKNSDYELVRNKLYEERKKVKELYQALQHLIEGQPLNCGCDIYTCRACKAEEIFEKYRKEKK
jgi:hypothetical protein